MTDHRTLYMSTDHALYRARPDAGGRWRAEGVALAGLGGVRCLLIDPDDRRHWWACTATSGIMVSQDEGISWRESNRGLTGLSGWCLARHSRTGVLWYGAEPASVFRSSDDGETWSVCEGVDELLRRPDGGRVRHIALSAHGLVLAAVEVGGLLRSEDRGTKWERVSEGLDRDCHASSFVPGEPDVVIASTGSGIYRSQDRARSFDLSSDGLRHRYMTQVVVHRERPEVVLTAASECDPLTSAGGPEEANGAFYRSDDRGRTWWRLTGGLPEVMRPAPSSVAGDPGDPDSFYVGMSDGSVWLSEDGGESFRIAVEGIQGWVRHLLLVRK